MTATLTTRREILTVSEDGICKNAPVSFGFVEDTMKWTVALPNYVAGLLKADEWIAGENLREVISTYEVYCDEYSKKRLGIRAENAIRVFVGWSQKPGTQTASVGIEWMKVKVVRDGENVRIFSEEMHPLGAADSVLLPDTPDVVAKLGTLMNSLGTAYEILAGLHTAPDPAAYLLAISNDWQAPAAATTGQAELPFDGGVSAAEKHALSKPVAPIVPEDDDEL